MSSIGLALAASEFNPWTSGTSDMVSPIARPLKPQSSATPLPKAPLESLANLGPKSTSFLAAAGVTNFEELKCLGSVAVYAKVKQVEPRASLNLLWALEGELTGLHWRKVAKEHRTSLLLALESHEQQNNGKRVRA